MSLSLTTDRRVPGIPAGIPTRTDHPGQESQQESLVPDLIRDAQADLDAARAAAEAEETQQGNPPAAAPRAPAGTQAAPPAGGPSPQPAVPFVRFQQVVAQARQAAAELKQASDEANYWKGVAHARQAMGQGGNAPADGKAAGHAAPSPSQTVPELIAGQQARLLTAAKSFDEGELTMEAWTAIQIEVGNEIDRLRGMASQASPTASTSQVGVADQLVMQRHMTELGAAHPWVAVLPKDELQVLARMAFAQQEALGTPIEQSSAGTMRLRELVASMSDFFGPTWHPDWIGKMPAGAAATPPQAVQTPQGIVPVNPQTPPQQPRAQGNGKIDLALRHPPNPTGIGHAAPPSGDLTEDQIAKMSQEEWDALPASVRARALSG
jgi:hypothetical protein